MKISKDMCNHAAWAITIMQGGLIGVIVFHVNAAEQAWWVNVLIGMGWGIYITCTNMIQSGIKHLLEFFAEQLYRNSKDYFIDKL